MLVLSREREAGLISQFILHEFWVDMYGLEYGVGTIEVPSLICWVEAAAAAKQVIAKRIMKLSRSLITFSLHANRQLPSLWIRFRR